MSRRRLRLSCSSDEEDGQPPPPPQPEEQVEQERMQEDEIGIEELTVNHQSETLTSPSPNPGLYRTLNRAQCLEISDEELICLSDNLSPRYPPPPTSDHSFQPPHVVTPESVSGAGSGCPIEDFLRGLGLRLRREWLDSCIGDLESSVPGFASLDVAAKSKLCFGQFLDSDMNRSGSGCLPENVSEMHLVDLAGPFVLQVDEIVNISRPLRGRYQNEACGMKRCLKLSMTDGAQRVFGMEYRPIKCLEVLAPAGLKVAIRNVNIRHGLLMLVPEVIEVLGGAVEELDAARQRLVHEINKPPRGKRTRTGVVPPLATRATLAAWSIDDASGLESINGSVPESSASFQANDHRVPSAASFINTSDMAVEEQGPTHTVESAEPEPNHSNNAVMDVEDIYIVDGNAEPIHSNSAVLEDVCMVDEVERSVMLNGNKEIPFTYLACLSAKWAATKEKMPSVQGRIKCFMTGVKKFHFKQSPTYELLVYVDDGSLISEILVDHNVVHKRIGYSPEEVTASLDSSNAKRVSGMREIMKQFQLFLVNFEGTMLIEISKASTIPVAIEMNQGCSASDAWLLLKRLNTVTSAQTSLHTNFDAIELSP